MKNIQKNNLVNSMKKISFFIIFSLISACVSETLPKALEQCSKDECSGIHDSSNFEPHSPYIPCKFLDLEFLICEDPVDLENNETAREELGYGCTKFGGQKYEDVQFTSVNCSVLPGIDCFGPKHFFKDGFPCIKYTGHYFLTTLLYSVLLGFLGLDRFCLGHTGTAVGKMLTLGGVGIWWIVDIVLLVTGNLTPEDGSNWVPYA